jgi:Neuraminidase (sialidase)
MKPFPVFRPVPGYLQDSERKFQGVPSITSSPKGRLWVAWDTGDVTEGDENAAVVGSSGDGGNTWSSPLFAIDQPGPLRVICGP